MTPALAQRELALACVALLGAVVALALGASFGADADDGLPQPVATWYTSRATVYRPQDGRRGACGVVDSETRGVAHPVLPCNTKLYIAYGDKKVLTQVVDRLPSLPGPPFDITERLAQELGLRGTVRIRWSFAR